MGRIMRHTEKREWFDKRSGASGVYKLVTLVEFEGCSYKARAVLQEEGKPDFDESDPMSGEGQVAPQFINNARVLGALGFAMPSAEQLAVLG